MSGAGCRDTTRAQKNGAKYTGITGGKKHYAGFCPGIYCKWEKRPLTAGQLPIMIRSGGHVLNIIEAGIFHLLGGQHHHY